LQRGFNVAELSVFVNVTPAKSAIVFVSGIDFYASPLFGSKAVGNLMLSGLFTSAFKKRVNVKAILFLLQGDGKRSCVQFI
jgi:hypothetical protein